MSTVVNLAEAVVAELEECGAELSFFPEFELRDLDEMRVVVVPVGTQYKTLSRSSHEELPRVQIGILKRGSEGPIRAEPRARPSSTKTKWFTGSA